ncbi:MAG: hypothetical protein ACR2RB_03805 [Gammaproteobacteria bacterium]
MTEEQPRSAADIARLKRDYRHIKAPAYLATRVNAHVSQSRRHALRWKPALAGAVALALMWVVFVPDGLLTRGEHPSSVLQAASMPSLARIGSKLPSSGAIGVPGGVRFKLPKMPRMPARPRIKKPDEHLPRTELNAIRRV